MRRPFHPAMMMFLVASLLVAAPLHGQEGSIKLPPPRLDGGVSVEKALLERRSVRSYKDEPLALAEISQLLWAAQGVTEPKRGLRTAPSARASYLLEVYVVAAEVTGLPAGMYRYRPRGHELARVSTGDIRADLFSAVGQPSVRNAPAALLIAGSTGKGTNPEWMYLEAGHAAQNVYLQAVSLELGTVVMAGFKPDAVKKELRLPEGEQPIYVMPVGRK